MKDVRMALLVSVTACVIASCQTNSNVQNTAADPPGSSAALGLNTVSGGGTSWLSGVFSVTASWPTRSRKRDFNLNEAWTWLNKGHIHTFQRCVCTSASGPQTKSSDLTIRYRLYGSEPHVRKLTTCEEAPRFESKS